RARLRHPRWPAAHEPVDVVTPYTERRRDERAGEAGDAGHQDAHAAWIASAAAEPLEISAHHHLDEVREGDARRPAEYPPCPGRVPDQVIDLRRPQEGRLLAHDGAPVEAGRGAGDLDQLLDGVRSSRG